MSAPVVSVCSSSSFPSSSLSNINFKNIASTDVGERADSADLRWHSHLHGTQREVGVRGVGAKPNLETSQRLTQVSGLRYRPAPHPHALRCLQQIGTLAAN